MRLKAQLMDASAMRRALIRISHEIIERESQATEFLLVGIRRKGTPLAKRIAENLQKITDLPVTTAELDISDFRDDKTTRPTGTNNSKIFPETVDGKIVILVDDVIYTGRTVRAALDALIAAGRPAAIRFAALIDRGHRELPIRPDFVGKNIPTSRKESVEVKLPEIDGEECVLLTELESV